MVETKIVDGFRITRGRVVSDGASVYIKFPKFGDGMFEIISASMHPSNALPYATIAKILYQWGAFTTELKTGYIGAGQALTIENVKIVGPGVLMAEQIDPTTFSGVNWLDVTYRRL